MSVVAELDQRQSVGVEISHYACCDAPDGAVEPMLCGYVDEVEDDTTDHVDCVVCTDLEAHGYCPRHGVCPYGDDS